MSEEYLQLNSVSHMSVEEIWHYFHDHVMNSVKKHVPSKVLSTRFHLSWLTNSKVLDSKKTKSLKSSQEIPKRM